MSELKLITQRRNFLIRALAVAGSAAMTTPAGAAAIGSDPIFAMIATHKTLTADWQRLYDQLDEAEWNAAKEHGRRTRGADPLAQLPNRRIRD
jgi:hypothetical protein